MASLRTLLDLVLSGQRSGQRSFLGDSPGEDSLLCLPSSALGHSSRSYSPLKCGAVPSRATFLFTFEYLSNPEMDETKALV